MPEVGACGHDMELPLPFVLLWKRAGILDRKSDAEAEEAALGDSGATGASSGDPTAGVRPGILLITISDDFQLRAGQKKGVPFVSTLT